MYIITKEKLCSNKIEISILINLVTETALVKNTINFFQLEVFFAKIVLQSDWIYFTMNVI